MPLTKPLVVNAKNCRWMQFYPALMYWSRNDTFGWTSHLNWLIKHVPPFVMEHRGWRSWFAGNATNRSFSSGTFARQFVIVCKIMYKLLQMYISICTPVPHSEFSTCKLNGSRLPAERVPSSAARDSWHARGAFVFVWKISCSLVCSVALGKISLRRDVPRLV